jgi:hypothetical protein
MALEFTAAVEAVAYSLFQSESQIVFGECVFVPHG